MRYKNTKTGAIVDSSFKITGEHWEVSEEGKVNEEKGLERHTKTELFEMLEARKIKYKPEQIKAELIELLEE